MCEAVAVTDHELVEREARVERLGPRLDERAGGAAGWVPASAAHRERRARPRRRPEHRLRARVEHAREPPLTHGRMLSGASTTSVPSWSDRGVSGSSQMCQVDSPTAWRISSWMRRQACGRSTSDTGARKGLLLAERSGESGANRGPTGRAAANIATGRRPGTGLTRRFSGIARKTRTKVHRDVSNEGRAGRWSLSRRAGTGVIDCIPSTRCEPCAQRSARLCPTLCATGPHARAQPSARLCPHPVRNGSARSCAAVRTLVRPPSARSCAAVRTLCPPCAHGSHARAQPCARRRGLARAGALYPSHRRPRSRPVPLRGQSRGSA